MFSAVCTKGNNFCNFLFASLDKTALSKWGPLLRERIGSLGSQFFPLRVDPFCEGSQIEIDRVASPENESIYLKRPKLFSIMGWFSFKLEQVHLAHFGMFDKTDRKRCEIPLLPGVV